MNIDLGKNIAARDIETRIQEFWDSNDFWANDVNSAKTPFCMMMPPPNVTGNLHMGHVLDNVLSDMVCRYKRMCGFDVLWQPGTDHAAIATQLLVERDLSKRGINPHALSLEEKLNYAWKRRSDIKSTARFGCNTCVETRTVHNGRRAVACGYKIVC